MSPTYTPNENEMGGGVTRRYAFLSQQRSTMHLISRIVLNTFAQKQITGLYLLSTVYALKLSYKNVGGLDKNDWNIYGVIQEYFLKL